MHEPLSRRTVASLAAACGVHAVLLAVTWKHAPVRPPQDLPAAADAVEEWEIETPPDIGKPEPSSNAPASPLAAREVARRWTAPSEVPATPPPSDSGSSETATPPSESGEAWSLPSVGRKPIDLGLGTARGPAILAPGGAATAEPPADERPSRTGGLVEALDAEDAARGFGRGGPVKLAVEAAARTTDAPTVGKATFDVAVNGDGSLHVTLLSANTDYEGWNRITQAIRSHLGRKRVRIPPGAKGLHVVVEVEAKEQFPDGTSPSSLGGKVGIGPAGPAASYRGKVCRATISLAGITGGCSPENAGVAPTRMVSSRIVKETRL
ncbi:hypothetical protein LZC95_28470 [Pendulispora brunnea]|uniref:Uncharacterized protein n=1 Tax=Pendulispora brunnea TaxID=2905690 RepID=A0ABZ2JVI5_9BACT